MTTFVDSCIAKDSTGQPQIFSAGKRVRVHASSVPQTDGMTVTVRGCFYQRIDYSDRCGLAVLLNELSWEWCENLEVLP